VAARQLAALERLFEKRQGFGFQIAAIHIQFKAGDQRLKLEQPAHEHDLMGAMQPENEVQRRRFGELVGGVQPINLALQSYMGARLNLEIAPVLGLVELTTDSPLDLARRRVVTLDQIRVLAIHHAHEVGQVRRRARMLNAAASAFVNVSGSIDATSGIWRPPITPWRQRFNAAARSR